MIFNYLKKHLLNKQNVLLFLIFLFISFALMITSSICYTFLSLKNDLYSNNLRFRTLIMEKDDQDIVNQISKINHVVSVEDSIYGRSLDVLVNEFDSDINGEIVFFPVLDNKMLKINNGRNIKSDNEVICSDIFYPYEIERKNHKIIFNKNRILKPETFIDKRFTLTLENEDSVDFKIVGTYDSSKNNNYLNACYVTKDVFKKIMPEYNGGTSMLDETTGEMVFIPKEYTGKIIIVDNFKNLSNVKSEFDKLHIIYYPAAELNSSYVALITYTPILFSVTLLIILSIILESFLTKKIKYNSKNYAILKAIGYKESNIVHIDIIGNSLIYLLSFAISTIIYIVTFIYIKNLTFAEYIYDGTIIRFSFIPIIISMFMVYLVIFTINKKILKNKLESNISGILK